MFLVLKPFAILSVRDFQKHTGVFIIKQCKVPIATNGSLFHNTCLSSVKLFLIGCYRLLHLGLCSFTLHWISPKGSSCRTLYEEHMQTNLYKQMYLKNVVNSTYNAYIRSRHSRLSAPMMKQIKISKISSCICSLSSGTGENEGNTQVYRSFYKVTQSFYN